MKVSKSQKVNEPTVTPFEKAMSEVKALGERMLKSGEAEKIEWRRKYGMDEKGHPIKAEGIADPVTGEIVKKKRGRPRKVKTETITPIPVPANISVPKKSVEKVSKKIELKTEPKKPVKVSKPVKVKKKAKRAGRGRVASAPVVDFNGCETLDTKSQAFDKVMSYCFGKNYDGSVLRDGTNIVNIRKMLSPKGAFQVEFKTKDAVTKFNEYLELKKLYMSKIVRYADYLKPIKK